MNFDMSDYSIKGTLAKLKALAEEPASTADDMLDDLAAAEMIIVECEVPLSSAAVQHLMAQFLRRRVAVTG